MLRVLFLLFCLHFYSEQSTQKSALDPRAGRVDVVMPEIKFDPQGIVQHLEDLKYKKFTRVRNRKCIDRIITTYKKFAGGVFPIGIQKLDIDRDELKVPDVDEKAEELLEFENELYGKQRELKKINKRKRKKIVSNQEMFDEFQAKSNKVAKIKHEANVWTEEDNTANDEVSVAPKKSKKLKKKNAQQSNETPAETPKSAKKHKNSEWEKPLQDGEVEYFIPSKKKQLNAVPHVTKTADSVTTLLVTPSKESKPKTNGVKSSEKKVKSTSKLAQSKTSTPNIFVDKGTPASSDKRVKIALKMNRSQEVTEYIRQLKQSPHPYDSAKKPSKGVLKPNLAPSPINPFYKRLIGIE